MGYTHHWNYKNPISEINEIERLKKLEYQRLRGKSNDLWEDMAKFEKKFPTKDALNKRIENHILAFKEISKEINYLLKNLPKFSLSAGDYYKENKIVIKGGLGKGKPTVTESKIWLNGDESKDLDHETFALDLFESSPMYRENYDMEKGVFGFCKTARKPYDLVVCVSLLIIKEHLKEDFGFSSDGGVDDWGHALSLYSKLFNRKPHKDFYQEFGTTEEEVEKVIIKDYTNATETV